MSKVEAYLLNNYFVKNLRTISLQTYEEPIKNNMDLFLPIPLIVMCIENYYHIKEKLVFDETDVIYMVI